MSDETTTIEILKSDRDRLDELRRYPDEPYPAIIRRLLEEIEDPETLSREVIAGIQASLDEIRRGGFVTPEELKRDLGIE
jgi:predicted transcriptional regulator